MANGFRRVLRAGAVAAVAGGIVLGGAGIAAAQDEWPVQQPNSPIYVYDVDPANWLTPDELAYWNPLVNEPRLTSPFGTTPASCVRLPRRDDRLLAGRPRRPST